MKITAVDSAEDLFYIEDYFPTKLLDINLDNSLPWEDVPPFPRQMLHSDQVEKSHAFYWMYRHTRSQVKFFETFFNTALYLQGPRIWYDQPDFHMEGSHIDGDWAEGIVCPNGAMQIYLSEGKGQPGTTFYHPDRSSIRYEIPYKINCGYLMCNHLEQWHGVEHNTTNEKRLSLYLGFEFINQ
tara:strand:+ start:143 stop:691 length:549 start_codon:yes stop_codon:yes gene_type:complete